MKGGLQTALSFFSNENPSWFLYNDKGEGEKMKLNKTLIITLLLIFIVFTGVYFYKNINIAFYKLKGFDLYYTEHFCILFKPENKNEVALVADAAEKSYDLVGKDFNYFPKDKTPIVIYPDSKSLQKAFNWPADESAQGVYYNNFIFVQAPSELFDINSDSTLKDTFFKKGPMIHEYTHLVIDKLTCGNYPRWFTEGVAQYEEEKITGYNICEDYGILEGDKYSLDEMFYQFDNLDNVAEAYFQALEMTKQMVKNKGIGEIKDMLSLLRKGASAHELYLQRVG
jgi:hypothetical protein